MTVRHASLVRRQDLTQRQRDEMFQLLDAHFTGVSRPQFDADLANKAWIVFVEDDTSTLRGFSTLALSRTIFRGRSLTIACSGDTIVERSRPESAALLQGWIRAVLQ